ncbi:MAG: hypothetical protein AAF993_21430 [Pseudomonadota bacterium]
MSQFHPRSNCYAAPQHKAWLPTTFAALLVMALLASPVWAADATPLPQADETTSAELASVATTPVTTPATTPENPPAVAQKRSQVAEMPAGVMQLDETVISGNQELPKVLYILPWREPQGLPDIEIQAEFTEAEVFRRLYPPAYRRELSYFETLRGLQENISPDQEE